MAEPVTLSGTKIFLSPTLPASYSQSSFEALGDWVELERVTEVSGGGFSFEDASYSTLSSGFTIHNPGIGDREPISMSVIKSAGATGQTLLINKSLARAAFSLKVIYPAGEIDYATVKGNGFSPEGGDGNSYRTASVSLWVNERGVIEVPGPDDVTFTLTYAAGTNGTLTGAAVQSVFRGENGTPVEAVPDATYAFVEWSDGSKENPRTDVFINGNITVTATFALA